MRKQGERASLRGVFMTQSPKAIAATLARTFFWVASLFVVVGAVSQWPITELHLPENYSKILNAAFMVSAAQIIGYLAAGSLALYLLVARLVNRIFVAHQAVVDSQVEILTRLASAAEMRDGATYEHCYRVGRFAQEIAMHMGVAEGSAKLLFLAAQLHDIGKIAVPDSILHKPGRLDPDERKIMEWHVRVGGELLEGVSSPMLELAEVVTWTHHEKWDGTGYPNRLKGEEIPLEGRIVAVADVFDALTQRRPYKEPMPLEKAIAIINNDSGTHFDPEVVVAFNKALPRLKMIIDRNGEYSGGGHLHMPEEVVHQILTTENFKKAA